jgi:Ca-activated chloride channel family protein
VSARNLRTWVALALQCAALAVLSLSLFGRSWLDPRSQPRLLVLVDRSQSVPRADADKALAELVQAAKTAGMGELQLIEFAGRAVAGVTPGAAIAPATGPVNALEPAATNIEAALEAALAAHAQLAYASAVIISDGLENVGNAAHALDAVRAARLPLQWMAVGRAPPPIRIAQVLAPQTALVGQRIDIVVQLAGQQDRPLLLKATARNPGGETRESRGTVDSAGRATITIDTGGIGAVRVDLSLEDPATDRVLDALPDAALIDVAPRAAILYVRGSTGPLARSLVDGGWTLNVVDSERLDAQADALAGYQAVVLDDVAVSAASPRFWHALAAAVRQRGLGLLVLGGEHAFERGGYRESTLESVLPVLSEPAAVDQPAAIVFAVDKSGSMGQGSGGVDRFALAQRAVLETARGLTERDSLGLVVFDVEPRVLISLGPAAAGTMALERDWQASPSGGTKLAPALDAAIGQLERSAAARRMLVLVTDGFVDDAPLAGLRARLERSRIETIALAVGADADVGALQRLVGEQTGAGQVLRVEQAAGLPLAMRSGVERRRSRVERGTIAVQQRQPLPFQAANWNDWPDVAAYAVTRSRPEAVVAVQSQRGDPLIAFQNFGLGRVVVVTSGLGPWAPLWSQWKQWPQLAGGLTGWIGAADGATTLTVSDMQGALQVEAEVRSGKDPSDAAGVFIMVDTPVSQGQLLRTQAVAPGRLRATLRNAGPGLYTFVVSDAHGIHRHLHLRRDRAENEAWGINPALDAWVASGVVSRWNTNAFSRHRDDSHHPIDRSLIALALALFLSGVVVERTSGRASIGPIVRRWRSRA